MSQKNTHDITSPVSVTLTIERVNDHSQGVAKRDDKKFLVPFVLDGEEVLATSIKKAGPYFKCELQEVLKPSVSRVLPPCPVFGVCGGCDLQHVAYSEELRLKQGWLESALKEFNITVGSIVPSPQEYGYRNRVTLHRKGENVGFYQNQSHDVVAIQACALASAALNQKIEKISYRDFGVNQELEIREDDGSDFVQVNSLQNQNLIRVVLDYVGKAKRAELLELYSGRGNLSFSLAQIVHKVTAIEGNQEAVLAARREQKVLAVKNISFLAGTVHDIVFGFCQDLKKFDVVVCDPPREGLRETAKLIKRLKVNKVVCVSCDYHAFVKDARILLAQGYQLKAVAPLDMFPRTRHIEIVALFEAA